MNQPPPNWRDKLHPASFRGISFLVDADDIQAGRRLQIHEFPKRDKAFAEDMGRSTREINLTAWVAGDDFMASRTQLLEALEKARPGTLVHPWYGRRMSRYPSVGRRASGSFSTAILRSTG